MTFQAELEPKYLQILKELLPNLSRVTLIRAGADNNPHAPQIAAAAAASLGISLVEIDLRSPDDLPQAFRRLERENPQALIAAPSGLLYAYRRQFVEFTAKNRIPAIYGLREVVADGGLLSLSPSLSDIAVRGAYYVDRIFKGAKPADLPVEQPTTFEFIINLKSAKLWLADPALASAAGGSRNRVMDCSPRRCSARAGGGMAILDRRSLTVLVVDRTRSFLRDVSSDTPRTRLRRGTQYRARVSPGRRTIRSASALGRRVG
jgi:hypothetical protein